MTTSTATTTVPYAEQLRPAGPCWAKPCCAPPCRGRCTAGCSAKGSAPPPRRPRLTTCSTRSALRPAAGQRQDLRLAHACDRRLPPRAGSIMTDRELGQITAPPMFCLATGDPFLSPAQARPAIARTACQHGAAGRAPLRRSPTPRSPTGMPTMTCGGSLSNAGRPRRAGRHLAAALRSSGRSSSRRHRTTVALPA